MVYFSTSFYYLQTSELIQPKLSLGETIELDHFKVPAGDTGKLPIGLPVSSVNLVTGYRIDLITDYAFLRYYDKLKPACIYTGEKYEERVARRQAEIEGLEDALKFFEGQDLPPML